MTRRAGSSSTATTVFIALVMLFVVLALVVAGLLTWEASKASRTEAERTTQAVTGALATDPEVTGSLGHDDAHERLQPRIDEITVVTGVDFITIMTPDGIRVTHPDEDEIGRHYLGTIPAEPASLTEEYTGTLGPSVRTITPVRDGDVLVGWVSSGVTVATISDAFVARLPTALLAVALVIGIGVAGAVGAQRYTRHVTGDLPLENVRSAVAAYESVRTLGQALRSQMHEHGNRMHTAVALIELGRSQEAVTLLTDTSRQSQRLVDLVAERRDGDPAVGALLLGKSAQAAERGISMELDVAPDAPRSTLTTVEAIALLGNLVDNALDAASEGDEPRWVRTALLPEKRRTAPARRSPALTNAKSISSCST